MDVNGNSCKGDLESKAAEHGVGRSIDDGNKSRVTIKARRRHEKATRSGGENPSAANLLGEVVDNGNGCGSSKKSKKQSEKAKHNEKRCRKGEFETNNSRSAESSSRYATGSIGLFFLCFFFIFSSVLAQCRPHR